MRFCTLRAVKRYEEKTYKKYVAALMYLQITANSNKCNETFVIVLRE